MPGSALTVPTVHTTRAAGVVWFDRDVAEAQRAFGGGEERIAPHRDWRRSRMRGLADKAEQVTLDTKGAEDHAGRLFIDSSTGPCSICSSR